MRCVYTKISSWPLTGTILSLAASAPRVLSAPLIPVLCVLDAVVSGSYIKQ